MIMISLFCVIIYQGPLALMITVRSHTNTPLTAVVFSESPSPLRTLGANISFEISKPIECIARSLESQSGWGPTYLYTDSFIC